MINNKTFYISIIKPGKEPEEVIPSSSARSLSIGVGKDCDIIASIPSLPARHSIVKKGMSGYYLVMPPSASLSITIGDSTVPIKGLVDLGLLKKKGEFYLFPIPGKVPCTVKSDDIILTFGYKEKPATVKKARIKVDSSLKTHFVKREDYAFIAILLTVYILGSSFAAYINSMKIAKKESTQAIKEMSQRFAKLVMEAPKKVAPKNIGKGMTTSGEGKGAKTEETPAKEAMETMESKEDKETKKPARTGPSAAPAEVASAGSSAAVISGGGGGGRGTGSSGGGAGSGGGGSVKSRGLLGVIMAKSKPPEFMNQDMFGEAEDTGKAAASGVKTSRSGGHMAASEVLSDIVTAKNQGGGTGGILGGGFGDGSGGGIGTGVGSGVGTGVGAAEGPAVSKGGKQRAADIIKEKKDIIVAEAEKEKPQKRDAETMASLRKRDESEIYKTIISYVGGLKYLYNNALRKDSTLKGKVSAKIIVGQDGKVKEATLASSTLNSKDLEEAILSRILKWKFPELLGGDEFSITYTFDFSPVG